MSPEWERRYEEARRLHQAGRLDEALTLYNHIIGGNPSHGGTMHMLGLIAYQRGRTDTAVDLLRQAAVLDPLVGSVHSNLGLALMARGRIAAAEDSFRRALLMSPQAETHASLAQLLQEQGRLEEAAAGFRAALQRNPNLADAQTGLGETLWKLGRGQEAEAAYEKAALLSPGSENFAHLALLAFARGDAAGAMDRIQQALEAGETPAARRIFATIVARLRFERDDAEMRAMLGRALEEGWAHPAALLAPAAGLVKLALRDGGNIAQDALLQLMLVSAPNLDPELEAMLTMIRQQLLAQPESRELGFTAALAQQCFINEYVWAEQTGERERVEVVAGQIEQALATDDVVSAKALLTVACYRALGSLKHADRLLVRAWPDPLEPVLRQQIEEPAEEKRLGASLPSLTPIDDSVSEKVRAQYEEHPYPRWLKLERGEAPRPLAVYLGMHFPAFVAEKLPLLPDMLFAGCGTGRFTLELAHDHPAASRLAVDLSRASLGYAARKAADEPVVVEFAQADILRLPETKKRFSMIESSGVLHHMAKPFDGWKALATCLAPGGVMRVSLYSALARRPVEEARAWIAANGFATTPDGIRQARQRLMAEKPAEARLFLASPDFFSTSECRDLLFHVEEHALTLPEIDAFLRENGLDFLGFEIGDDVLGAYRARFPKDPDADNLENWVVFEAEHDALFAGMYQFWVQKP